MHPLEWRILRRTIGKTIRQAYLYWIEPFRRAFAFTGSGYNTRRMPRTKKSEHRTGAENRAHGLAHLVYILPALVYATGLTAAPPIAPVIEPDTLSYLHFSGIRTAGYPYFLWTVERLTGDAESAVYFQVWIFAAALGALGRAVLRETRSALFALGLVLAIAANPELVRFHFSLLTESLFVSATVLIIAFLIRAAYRPRWRDAAALSALMGIAIALRPVGYAFLPLLPALALLRWRDLQPSQPRFLAAAVLPAMLVILLETAVYAAHNGLPRKSLAGLHAFGKAALVETAAANPYAAGSPYRALWDALEKDAAPARALIGDAPGFGASKLLRGHYESVMQYSFARPEIAAAQEATGLSAHEVMSAVGFERLATAPAAYLRLTANHFGSLWLLYGASHPGAAARLNAYLDANRPLPLLAELNSEKPFAQPIPSRRIALIVQPGVLALGVVTAVAVLAAAIAILRGRAPPTLLAAGLCGLMVNGNFLLTALTAIGLARYTLAMWPGMIACAALLAWATVEEVVAARKRRDRSAASPQRGASIRGSRNAFRSRRIGP